MIRIIFLITYTVLFFLGVIIYVVLYSAKQEEIKLLSISLQKVHLLVVRLLKLVPTMLALFFVSFQAPSYGPFFLLLIIAFCFCFLGDLGMVLNLFLGVGLFALAHTLFATAYILQLISFPFAQITANYTFVVMVLVLVLFLGVLTTFYFLFRKTLPIKFTRPKLMMGLLFFYLSLVFFHVITSTLFVYNYYILSQGIIVVILGSLLFLFSDLVICIRECHDKPRFSVLLISTTYYLALFSISLITQFYP